MEKRYIAALLSGLVFPGAGQFSNGQPAKGAVYVLVTLLSIIALVLVIARCFLRALEIAEYSGTAVWNEVIRGLGASRITIVVLLVILGVVWVAGIVDAYVTAKEAEDRDVKRFISRRG